jgi:hypothetical protein
MAIALPMPRLQPVTKATLLVRLNRFYIFELITITLCFYEKKVKEEFAKTIIDLGKFIFAGVVLGTVTQIDFLNRLTLIIFGSIFTIILISFGLIMLNRS